MIVDASECPEWFGIVFVNDLVLVDGNGLKPGNVRQTGIVQMEFSMCVKIEEFKGARSPRHHLGSTSARIREHHRVELSSMH